MDYFLNRSGIVPGRPQGGVPAPPHGLTTEIAEDHYGCFERSCAPRGIQWRAHLFSLQSCIERCDRALQRRTLQGGALFSVAVLSLRRVFLSGDAVYRHGTCCRLARLTSGTVFSSRAHA